MRALEGGSSSFLCSVCSVCSVFSSGDVAGADASVAGGAASTGGSSATAPNGAFLSSGGVHSIPAEYWSIYQQEDDSGYDVRGLTDWIVTAGQTGKLFSELDVPWARKCESVSLAKLRSVSLGQSKG